MAMDSYNKNTRVNWSISEKRNLVDLITDWDVLRRKGTDNELNVNKKSSLGRSL